MHRLAIMEGHLACLTPAHVHKVPPHVVSNPTSSEHGEHLVDEQAEMDTANRERTWQSLHRNMLDIQPPTTNLKLFATSPDSWIARTPTLIPLTGPHPYNAEPPLPLLAQHLITPTLVHYVRNHGTVPRLTASTHTLTVSGLNSEYSRTFGMNLLEKLPQTSLVVTIAEAANRRKELNMARHTNSFSWGAAAVGTSKWTGVRLVDLLKEAGMGVDYRAGYELHLCFEGAADLFAGKYGQQARPHKQPVTSTRPFHPRFPWHVPHCHALLRPLCSATSLDLRYCLDPRNDVLIALKQNDEPLTSDHGYPVRLIVPGMVEGRQVKWLQRIWVQQTASDNWYHVHDNKLLPAAVQTEAAALAWWPRTPALYELNVTAVITQPVHQEWINATKQIEDNKKKRQQLPKDKGGKSGQSQHNEPPVSAQPDKYTVRGFAYAGGGRRIVRVEVSLDCGVGWQSAMLQFVDGGMERVSGVNSRNERHWSWCHWSLDVPLHAFFHAADIRCRAYDSAYNTTPELPIWNFLGVMNNSQYKVKVNYESPQSIHFFHPVQPGQLTDNGYLQPSVHTEQQDSAGGYATESTIGQRLIPLDEIKKHNKKDDCWLIIDGRVYDFSMYLIDHPGGDWAIAAHAGRNASRVFHDVHHDDVSKQKEQWCIGVVEPPKLPKELRPNADMETAVNVFNWVKARLKKRAEVSHDVRILTFDFPEAKGKPVGLPIGQHLLIGATLANHRFIVRPYGAIHPIGTGSHDDSILSIMIKVYYPGKCQPAGQLSNHLDTLRVGDEVRIKGPTGALLYQGKGWMVYQARSFHVSTVNLIVGGTGVVPAYQLLVAILREQSDTKVALIYSSTTPADILLRTELAELAAQYNTTFHLYYTVDSVSSDEKDEWQFGVERINEALLRKHLYPPTPKCVCFVCGPPSMMELAVYPNLKKCGFDRSKQVLEF